MGLLSRGGGNRRADPGGPGKQGGEEDEGGRRSKRAAEVSKKWIALGDTYTVEVAAGEDDALILAMTVVVEQMCMD